MNELTVLQLSEPPSVLLAEDDPDDAFFMQRAFELSGLPNQLFVVRDGVEAVDFLNGNAPFADRQTYPLPGLLLLDPKLPRKNGFEVLEWVQGRPEFNHLPIVILSGSDLDCDMQRARTLGADDYRVKTSGLAHLTRTLHELHTRWLNGHRKGVPVTRVAS